MSYRIQPASLALGVLLLAAGVWLIASASGVPLVSPGRIWPLASLLVGLILLIQFARDPHRQTGLALIAVFTVLISSFLCVFTLQIGNTTWGDMARYWPVILIVMGVALVAGYIAGGMREHGLLVPAYILGGAGIVLLLVTLRIVFSDGFRQAIRFWPFLAVLGAALWWYARTHGNGPAQT